jgi:3-isopropylmalate/(R)-2-methylmalate dehydratase small subunit
VRESFEVDPFVRTRLLNGLDDIGMTLQEDASITAFEEKRPRWLDVAEKV